MSLYDLLVKYRIANNPRLGKAISGIVAGVFLLITYQQITADYHGVCNEKLYDGEGGYECLGEYVAVPGADILNMAIAGFITLWAGWYAITPIKDERSELQKKRDRLEQLEAEAQRMRNYHIRKQKLK